MKRRKFRKQKRRIQALAQKWIGPLGVGWWEVEHHYHDNRDDWKTDDGEILMETHWSWKYRTAVIHVNIPALVDRNDEQLERHYVHELVHILVGEALVEADDKKDHVERAVEGIARAFIWLREHAQEEGGDV